MNYSKISSNRRIAKNGDAICPHVGIHACESLFLAFHPECAECGELCYIWCSWRYFAMIAFENSSEMAAVRLSLQLMNG